MNASTIPLMFAQADKSRGTLVQTDNGGWHLLILASGTFRLGRYQHIILVGDIADHHIFEVYPDMLKTDRAGADRFLAHFGFPSSIKLVNQITTYEVN